MTYRKEFLKEYYYLKESGMPEETIEDFYLSIALDVIQGDDTYSRHNKSLYPNWKKDDSNPDIFCYQRGSVRKKTKSKKELEEDNSKEELEKDGQNPEEANSEWINSKDSENYTDWGTKKIISVTLSTEDKVDVYLEHIEITEQLKDEELKRPSGHCL